jgi:hypothetical protein
VNQMETNYVGFLRKFRPETVSKNRLQNPKSVEIRSIAIIPLVARVTRLGEFSPNGRSFTLGSFNKDYRSSPNVWASYFLSIYVLCIDFDKKIGWATFRTIFSQTYLVTLRRCFQSRVR